jgi:hypothetical protein
LLTPSWLTRDWMMLIAWLIVAASTFELPFGAALEDQLDAALEVEPELRLARLGDARDPERHEQRDDHQPGDERQHERVAPAVTHRLGALAVGHCNRMRGSAR